MNAGRLRRYVSFANLLIVAFAFILQCVAVAASRSPASDVAWSAVRSITCRSAACNTCQKACPSTSELKKEDAYCRQAQTLLRQTDLNDAYISCTKTRCESTRLWHACGLITRKSGIPIEQQLDDQLKKTNAKVSALMKERTKFREQNAQNPSLQVYYENAMRKIQQCNALFRNALSSRAHNIQLKDYTESLQYRRVNQEVKRFKFENEDLRRHLKFWKDQFKTLSHAVKTSPEGLKDARDALLDEMHAYEADATLMEVLQDKTVTKEDRAKLIIKLKQNVRAEIQHVRTQNARLLRERKFILHARREIYALLRAVLMELQRGKIDVRCGGNMLTDIFTDAINTGKSSDDMA